MLFHNLFGILISIFINFIELITHIIPVGFILWVLNIFGIDILNENIIVLSLFIFITTIIIGKILLDKIIVIFSKDKGFFLNTIKMLIGAISTKDYIDSFKSFINKNFYSLIIILGIGIVLFSVSYNNIRTLNDLINYSLGKNILANEDTNNNNINHKPHTLNIIINRIGTKILDDYIYSTYKEVLDINITKKDIPHKDIIVGFKKDICSLYKIFDTNIQECNDIKQYRTTNLFQNTQADIMMYHDFIGEVTVNKKNNMFDLKKFLGNQYKTYGDENKGIKDIEEQYNAIIALKKLQDSKNNIFYIKNNDDLNEISNLLSIIIKRYKQSVNRDIFNSQLKNICKIYYFIGNISVDNKVCKGKLSLDELLNLKRADILNIIDTFKVEENANYVDKLKDLLQKVKTINNSLLVNNLRDDIKQGYTKTLEKYKEYRNYTILTDENLNNYYYQKKKLLGLMSILTLHTEKADNFNLNKVYKFLFFPIEPISNNTIINFAYYIFLVLLIVVIWIVIFTILPLLDIIYIFLTKDTNVGVGTMFIFTFRIIIAILLYAILFNF